MVRHQSVLVWGALVIVVALGGLMTVSSGALGAGITLWEQEDQDTQVLLDRLFAEYAATRPGADVRRVHYGNEQLRDQYKTAAMGRGGPDVIIAPSDFAGPFAVMGIILPVESLGEAARLERFPANVLDAVRDARGRVWGLPLTKGNHLMLYANRRVTPVVPATVEAMVEAARDATNAGEKRFGLVYNLAEPFWFATFLGAFGGQLLDGERPALNTSAMRESLALARFLKFDEKIVPADCDYTCAESLFLEGKAAFLINGDWAMRKYRDALKDDLLVGPLPTLARTGKPMRPFISGKFLFLNAGLSGARLEEVKAFVTWFLSEPVQRVMLEKTRRLPPLISLADSPIIKSDQLLAASDRALRDGVAMPMAVEMRAVWDAIRPQLQGVMAGRVMPAEAARVMQTDAETKIREMRESGEVGPSGDCTPVPTPSSTPESRSRARVALSIVLLVMVGLYYRVRRERGEGIGPRVRRRP